LLAAVKQKYCCPIWQKAKHTIKTQQQMCAVADAAACPNMCPIYSFFLLAVHKRNRLETTFSGQFTAHQIFSQIFYFLDFAVECSIAQGNSNYTTHKHTHTHTDFHGKLNCGEGSAIKTILIHLQIVVAAAIFRVACLLACLLLFI